MRPADVLDKLYKSFSGNMMTPEERRILEQRSMKSVPVERIRILIDERGGHLSEDLREKLFGLRTTALLILFTEMKTAADAADAMRMTLKAIADSEQERRDNDSRRSIGN